MPRFEGTGPAGLGPMSGACRGFCIIRTFRSNSEPARGFAGLQGWSFAGFPEIIIEQLFLRRQIISLKQRIQRLNQIVFSLEFANNKEGYKKP